MKPSGSSPSYWNPGRRVIQFGVSRVSESQLWLRQRCATWPRSSTTCSMPRSDRDRLIARPACPAPMMTAAVSVIVVSTDVGRDLDGHAVGEHVEDRRTRAGLL